MFKTCYFIIYKSRPKWQYYNLISACKNNYINKSILRFPPLLLLILTTDHIHLYK